MAETDALLWVGDLLLGSTLRARILTWILQGHDEFFYSQVAAAFPSAGTNVNQQLDRLIDLGLIEALPNFVPGNRRVNYRRLSSPLWAGIHSLLESGEAAYRAVGKPAVSQTGRATARNRGRHARSV